MHDSCPVSAPLTAALHCILTPRRQCNPRGLQHNIVSHSTAWRLSMERIKAAERARASLGQPQATLEVISVVRGSGQERLLVLLLKLKVL